MLIDFYQMEFIDVKLRTMLYLLEENLGIHFVNTSLLRIEDMPSKIHGTLPLRAVDLRCRDLSFGKFIEEYMNKRYEYDPDRPEKKVCWCHDTGKGLHLHFQVHSKTLARG